MIMITKKNEVPKDSGDLGVRERYTCTMSNKLNKMKKIIK